jgi:c-di-GMP-binding flagellar brake protein YcgR
MEEMENRRKYFRHYFKTPLCSEMRILKVGEKLVNSKKTFVCIKNISAGGLLFETNLEIPVRTDVTFEFSMTICHNELILYGIVKRRHDLENRLYQYGVEFLLNNQKRISLLSIINEMSVKLRKVGNSGCSICKIHTTNCYKKTAKKRNKLIG